MTTLPDLNTANVGYIAYWNAINDGQVGSINVSDTLSNSNITQYTLYDNGWVGRYRCPTGRVLSARVKQDGWFIVYTDRTNSFTTHTGSKPVGYWDIVNDWSAQDGSTQTMTNNSFERSIHSLQSNLSNSGTITYNPTDVKLYNYQYPNAGTSSIMSVQDNKHDYGSRPATFTSDVIYTDRVTLEYASAQASCNYTGTVAFEGYSITGGQNSYGSVDLLANNLISNPRTLYSMTDSANGPNPDIYGGEHWYAQALGSVLIMWS